MKLQDSSQTLDTSNGLVRMFEDMSATKGTPLVSGMSGNSIPGENQAVLNILLII